jgi:uncharacterized repeat protein (TIGR01451 family)
MVSRIGRIARLLFLVLLLTTGLSSAPAAPLAALPGAAAGGVLSIPVSGVTPTLDAACADDYADAAALPYADLGGAAGKVSLKVAGDQLYVCVQAAPGSFKNRYGAVYLDPQGDGAGYTFAQKNDYALAAGVPGASDPASNGTFNGTGVANGYVPNSDLSGVWEARTIATANNETFEYKISAGRFFIKPCAIFGIAAYHHWVRDVGDDYGWPSNQYFDQPRTWQLARIDDGKCGTRTQGRIAYVYRGDRGSSSSFYNLLTANGYSVDLIPLGAVLTTDFSLYQLTVIADDTGSLDQWGSAGSTDAQIAKITAPNRPILGLGEGGYAFYGRLGLFIGWPNGWHGPQQLVFRDPGAPAAYYSSPNDLSALSAVTLYTEPNNTVGIFLGEKGSLVPSDAFVIGREPPNPIPNGTPSDHAPLIMQRCYGLWGYSGNPLIMTDNGQKLFVNAVQYTRTFQCPQPQTPPPDTCVKISKSADPPEGTPVAPGQVIRYTITYVFSNNPDCANRTAKIIDVVPADTIFVPGSASGGAAPGPDGALIWPVAPAAGDQTLTFKVLVQDTLCRGQSKVLNRAQLLRPDVATLFSNPVVHPASCPPIGLPNDQPPYAEREVEITPYPLVTGTPSLIKVRLTNSSATPQAVTVSFATSPQRFGIGIPFSDFSTRSVVIPALGSAVVQTTFTPVSSGHYCIQIKIQGSGFKPIFTYRNLDVTEDLTPGKPDDLVFKVANPTASAADITLVVVNTCPGWSAVVSPALLAAVGPNGADVRDATLTVTPPNPVTLGSACAIDVQGWIGDTLIGGIRKLDVPPVHLPHDVNPPWLEPEISVKPNPPSPGLPAQICIQLQNPLGITRVVTVEFSVADFGAGVPFTPVATQQFTLPPNSLNNYCVSWTPATSGTLHRCIQVVLKQPGYKDQRSQRNVDLRRAPLRDLSALDVPIVIHNDDLVPHKLTIDPRLIGIDPFWQPRIIIDPGDPPPEQIGAGETLNLRLRLQATPALAAAGAPSDFGYGDESRVDVSVKFDGEEISGFTVLLETPKIYLPIARRP